MSQLLCTLLGEGPSDDALMAIIEWVLKHPSLGLFPEADVVLQFDNPNRFPRTFSLADRIVESSRDLPCDVLFIHHDADSSTPAVWARAIREAISEARRRADDVPPSVPIVPVREMEVWLLIDEMSIRRVARKPQGRAPLNLPGIHEIERCADPKAVLREALRLASELPRRRWHQVDSIVPRAVADVIENYAPLRQLPAFQAFEAHVRRVIQDQGWPERLG